MNNKYTFHIKSYFFKLSDTPKELNLILSTVVMSIIFAKETMGPSLASSVLDSSQKFTPEFIKNLKMLIKILVVEQFI
jgi:hypothetical protein